MRILFRADASEEMGLGHLMRCLALIERACRSGHQVALLTSCPFEGILAKIHATGCTVLDMGEPLLPETGQRTIKAARLLHADWIVVDGYHFGSQFREALIDSPFRVAFFSDAAHPDPNAHTDPEIVINQNSFASRLIPARPSTTPEDTVHSQRPKLLYGSDYCCIREEFLALHPHQHTSPPPSSPSIAILCGGSDWLNGTFHSLSSIVDGLRMLPDDQVIIHTIVGQGYTQTESLKALISDIHTGNSPDSTLTVHLHTAPPDLPALMSSVHLALSSSGTTAWELAYLGTPMILGVTADNQWPVYNDLLSRELAWGVGELAKASPNEISERVSRLLMNAPERERMSAGARKLIDGQGTARILSAMENYQGSANG